MSGPYAPDPRIASASSASLPFTAVVHRCPRLGRRESRTILQKLDRNIVGGSNKRHAAVTRRAVDRDSGVHQPPAGLVNIVDLIGEVTEIAAARIAALVPIVRKLDLSAVVARNAEEDER